MRAITLAAICIAGCGSGSSASQPSDMSAGNGNRADLAVAGGTCTTCLLAGHFKLDNLSPCFITTVSDAGVSQTYATSSVLSGGAASCTPDGSKPTMPWSTDTLTTDCPGHYVICVVLKAGDPSAAGPSDCIVGQSCAEGDYATKGVPQAFAPLPAWISPPGAEACATAFVATGGYAEVTASGNATGCGTVASRVLYRVYYVPLPCNMNPNDPHCAPSHADGGADAAWSE